jgi:hypothetical protein
LTLFAVFVCHHARMRRWLKRLLGAGVVAGIAYAIWRMLDERSRASDLTWTAQPFPSPPRPEIREREVDAGEAAEAPPSESASAAWVDPDGGACPTTHPVKGKLASGIYHEPGGQMYDRTSPDRCYRDADAAIAEGLRASKR